MSVVFGGASIQLARVFGIRIGVHPSWFVVLFLMIWSLTGLYEDVVGKDAFVLAALSAFLFFASVVLHELGHAVVARRNGIETQGIDLWLLGGLARLSRDSDSPGVEFRVAAAGPAVTLVFGLACVGRRLRVRGRDQLRRRARVRGGRPRRRRRGGARVAHLGERRAARLQPDPRLPARRRPDGARDRVVANRRPSQGHALRQLARPGVRVHPDRLRPVPVPARRRARARVVRADGLLHHPGGQGSGHAEPDHGADRGPARRRRDGRRAGLGARRA